MTEQQIENLRRKAGIAKYTTGFTCWEGQLERFAALVAAHERERCAQVAEEPYEFTSTEASRIAAAIRALKD